MKSKGRQLSIKKGNNDDDKERLLSELIRRRAIGPESRNDRTFLNYLAGQKYDEVYVERKEGENQVTGLKNKN